MGKKEEWIVQSCVGGKKRRKKKTFLYSSHSTSSWHLWPWCVRWEEALKTTRVVNSLAQSAAISWEESGSNQRAAWQGEKPLILCSSLLKWVVGEGNSESSPRQALCAFLVIPQAASQEAQGRGGGGLGKEQTRWNVLQTEKHFLWALLAFCEHTSS